MGEWILRLYTYSVGSPTLIPCFRRTSQITRNGHSSDSSHQFQHEEREDGGRREKMLTASHGSIVIHHHRSPRRSCAVEAMLVIPVAALWTVSTTPGPSGATAQ